MARQRDEPRDGTGGPERKQLAGVAVAEGNLLDAGRQAQRGQTCAEPVRRLALGLGAGTPLERRQLLDDLAQQSGHRREITKSCAR